LLKHLSLHFTLFFVIDSPAGEKISPCHGLSLCFTPVQLREEYTAGIFNKGGLAFAQEQQRVGCAVRTASKAATFMVRTAHPTLNKRIYLEGCASARPRFKSVLFTCGHAEAWPSKKTP